MQKITIKELAKLLDVNPSTISRALHDHPDISQVLKERIKKIAKDFNFVPNHAAVNLRNKKSKLIGLILPEISMLFVPSIIEGVSNYLNKHNYNLLVLSSYENYEKEIENIDVCIKSNVDGILISLTHQTKNVDHLDRLNEFEIPVVIFDKTVEQVQFNEVKINDVEASKTCVDYLVKCGCKKIVGIFGNKNLSITKERAEGFQSSLNSYGLIPYEIAYAENSEQAFQQCKKLLSKTNDIDGIMMMSDEIMIGVNAALNQLSQEEKLSKINLVAISDGFLPTFMSPPIPYVHHSGKDLGKMSAELLIGLVEATIPVTAVKQLNLGTFLVDEF